MEAKRIIGGDFRCLFSFSQKKVSSTLRWSRQTSKWMQEPQGQTHFLWKPGNSHHLSAKKSECAFLSILFWKTCEWQNVNATSDITESFNSHTGAWAKKPDEGCVTHSTAKEKLSSVMIENYCISSTASALEWCFLMLQKATPPCLVLYGIRKRNSDRTAVLRNHPWLAGTAGRLPKGWRGVLLAANFSGYQLRSKVTSGSEYCTPHNS